MVDLVIDKQNELKTLCLRSGVKTLELFGSAAQGSHSAQLGDLDFLVEFLPMSPADHANAYFSLLDALRMLFQRPIDLLETKAIDNPYFLESINHCRVELYAA